MKNLAFFLFFTVPCFSTVQTVNEIDKVFFDFKSLQFEEAGIEIKDVKNEELKSELLRLKDLMYYAGQKDSTYFKTNGYSVNTEENLLGAIKMLSAGYFELYYHKTKGEAFKFFYEALQISKRLKIVSLQKASLMAILEYYHIEIAQNSRVQERYLKEFKALRSDAEDTIWINIYSLIFYTKTLETLNPDYFDVADQLRLLENKMDSKSSLVPKIDFELGLSLELQDKFNAADSYYKKAFEGAKAYPYLRDIRFFALIRRSIIAQQDKKFDKALAFIDGAKAHVDLADTLRSNYYINLYSSFYNNDLKKYDIAYLLLKDAYKADFQLDFRKNSLEINRLNVILKTQQKELENAQLRQNKTWLIVALSLLALLSALSYLAYKNIKAKKKIVEKEKEVQSQKMEKLLKDQELLSIDAMLEGQEKERQLIANDLHDNLGSVLTALKFNFQNIRDNKDVSVTVKDLLLTKTDALLEEAYQKVRGIAHATNAGVNAQEGLMPAVSNFAAKVSLMNKLSINVESHGMNKRLENALEITIFRIIQELITNVIKHARATEATINLTLHQESLNLMVEDNGLGFTVDQVKPKEGMGLHSIQKRIENLGGTVTIDSIAQKGTTLILDIPIP